ncbi:MAG TPA: Ig-like domain-containing protein [Gemmatimonadaceae bacterium]|nr:Ig-like domain-containing protein [Gemmatimonadaceae bacterium]
MFISPMVRRTVCPVRRVARVFGFILVLSACHDGATAPARPIDRVATLSPVSVLEQTGVVGEPVAIAPTVLARDASGKPVADVLVSFAGPTLTIYVRTAADGTAAANWMLPIRPGAYVMLATAGQLPPVHFAASAVAGPPQRIEAATAGQQAALPGALVGQAPVARVDDQFGNPLAGIQVTFETTGAGSTIEHTSAVTDRNGLASAGAWTVGTEVGTYTVTARIAEIESPLLFSARVNEPFVVSSMAAGPDVTCAIASAGATYCWGERYTSPVRMHGDEHFVSLTVGGGFVCGLIESGAAYCWGRSLGVDANDVNQGSIIFGVPTRVDSSIAFSAISAGGTLVCGLGLDRRAYCWGENDYGQLGDSSTVRRANPMPVWGDQTFVSVTAGYTHACGVTTTGETYCWGRDDALQLGDPSKDTCRTYEYDDYYYYYDPIVVETPCSSVPHRVSGVPQLVAVSAANGTCGLTSDGGTYCWGNAHGAQPIQSPVRFTSVAATDQFIVQPAPPTLSPASMCGLTDTGVVYCGTDSGLAQVESKLPFKSIIAGASHQCGIARDTGYAYCWGSNESGQLGNGTLTASRIPLPVATP